MIEMNPITVTDIVEVMRHTDFADARSRDIQENGISAHALVLRLSGESYSDFDGTHFHTVKGDIKYLPQGQGEKAHRVFGNTGECINISFHSDMPLADKPFVISNTDFEEYRRLFERIETIWTKRDVGYRSGAMSALYQILQQLQKSQDLTSTQYSRYLKIKPAIDYINENYKDSKIDCNEIASVCNLSYSYFRVLFTKCVGTPPARYITEKKIQYAKELLATCEFSIEQVSQMAGFKDIYYFSHVFKKTEGYSPGKLYKDKR